MTENKEEVGTTEWIRTTDPYHVKGVFLYISITYSNPPYPSIHQSNILIIFAFLGYDGFYWESEVLNFF